MTREDALLGCIKFAEFLVGELPGGNYDGRNGWITPIIGIGAVKDFCEAVLVLSKSPDVQSNGVADEEIPALVRGLTDVAEGKFQTIAAIDAEHIQAARNAVVSLVYSKRSGGMVDSAKLRTALDQLIQAVRDEEGAGRGQ